MFGIVYGLSVFFYFVVVKALTTYGYTEKEGRYGSSREKVRYKRLSETPIPSLLLIIVVGFVPILNTILWCSGFLYAASRGFGPTPADVREWLARRRVNKASKAADESKSS